MYDLSSHPYFTRWQDPESGIVSYILTERVAPLQQSFYFTNFSLTPDQKYLWFYVAFPPNSQRMLGVVNLDPDNPEIRYYPQSGFSDASPLVAPDNSGVYFAMGFSIYHMNLDGATRTVCTVSPEYVQSRHSTHICTHLSMSCDGKYFLLDGNLGNFWFVGLGDIATGEVKIIKEFPALHNHGLFSPTDPELFVIPEDAWNDGITGKYFCYDHRIWLMDIKQQRFEDIRPKSWDYHTDYASHEWWSRDGKLCWNDYLLGTFECDPYTLETTHVWKRSLCHAHCNGDRSLWCADQNPYDWPNNPVTIWFYRRSDQKELKIVSKMPLPSLPPRNYHVDPHPQFSPQGDMIVYTTTVYGNVDVALTEISEII